MTNDPKDRHVLAAAVKCRAHFIVTSNLRHFPSESLAEWGVEATHPDEFLLRLYESDPATPVCRSSPRECVVARAEPR